jgi:hypothetical protein
MLTLPLNSRTPDDVCGALLPVCVYTYIHALKSLNSCTPDDVRRALLPVFPRATWGLTATPTAPRITRHDPIMYQIVEKLLLFGILFELRIEKHNVCQAHFIKQNEVQSSG